MKPLRLFLMALLLSCTVIICSGFGGTKIPFTEVLRTIFTLKGERLQIIWNIRLPRVIMSVIAGAGLAIVGGVFQGLLRNPLVDPYLLGVSSGASFGAVVSLLLADVYGFSLLYRMPLISFGFAILAALMTVVLARRNGTMPLTELILSGVLVSILFSSGTIMVLMLLRKNITHAYVWLFGTLSGIEWKDLPTALISIVGFVMISVGLAQQLNAISLGETQAKISGVNVEFVKLLIYSVGSFTTATIVSVTGVIGFVGLITPHMARRLFGNDYRLLSISSAMVGGIFLCICDTIARTVVSPSELPIGVITAFVGAPLMFVLLKRGERNA
ncbi:FecCD family ABC transporter permease [Pseudothermotoga sp. U03pept]|uniref:FecCD family ABC transporter permease n=1 Tax=Pseudothermotoga sp. U03pept TaxID=3447012 RepID=UPI003F12292E